MERVFAAAAFTLVLIVASTALGGTRMPTESVGLSSRETAVGSDDEMQAFEVYDEITESIFESFRVYHPHECRTFFVRKKRSDGMTYVDQVRRCE